MKRFIVNTTRFPGPVSELCSLLLGGVLIIIFFIFIITTSYATSGDVVDITEFSDTMKEFNNEIIAGYDYEDIIEGIKVGNFEFDYKKIFSNAGNFMMKEIRSNIGLAIQIIIISLLMGFLDNLKGNFSSDGVSQIAFYVCYIVLVTLIIASFVQIYNVTYEVVVEIERFMKVLIPIIFGIIVASGGVTISSLIYPVLAFGTEFITIFMTNFLLPISMIAFSLGIISNIGSKVTISKLPSLLKSVSLWCMGIILTIFIGILSLEGTIASTVDGVTVKTAKFLFSGSVPVVGKLLGDSVDVILGSTLIIKDAVGFIGIAVLFGMALVPIIKIIVVIGIYGGLSAIIEPFSDKRICKCLGDTADAGKMLLGIAVCVTVMVIIGTVMLLKMTNFVSMHG